MQLKKDDTTSVSQPTKAFDRSLYAAQFTGHELRILLFVIDSVASSLERGAATLNEADKNITALLSLKPLAQDICQQVNSAIIAVDQFLSHCRTVMPMEPTYHESLYQ